mmetsp:Transcript_4040/g.7833  ORF Transcript_4040/g.7833 Transcript_4040/m.7833 type:complete len:284 (+) Transcript_4040:133-984(+)|eukprot:CAMPEP_0114256524 /NCGR_PEP_ID=MMETSP0058-20121206/18207_1 /TAXON_ID=36894 /ORGANISM="Pyramimonas parkeae, CCMP726" /LENGTH=283 /DNA_ID=CAMNT_0001371113 /DNA_START=110 /DNA_END=961 /DNA_ORIENTATION=-
MWKIGFLDLFVLTVAMSGGLSVALPCSSTFAKDRDSATYAFNLGQDGQDLASPAGIYNVTLNNSTVLFQFCQTLNWSKVAPAVNCPGLNPSTQAVAIHSDGSCDRLGRIDTTKLDLHVNSEDSVDGLLLQMSGTPRAGTDLDCSLDATLICGEHDPLEPTIVMSKDLCKYMVTLHTHAACTVPTVPPPPATLPPPQQYPPTTTHVPPSSHKGGGKGGKATSQGQAPKGAETGVALGATALVVGLCALMLSVFTAWKAGVFDSNAIPVSRRRGASMLEDILMND